MDPKWIQSIKNGSILFKNGSKLLKMDPNCWKLIQSVLQFKVSFYNLRFQAWGLKREASCLNFQTLMKLAMEPKYTYIKHEIYHGSKLRIHKPWNFKV